MKSSLIIWTHVIFLAVIWKWFTRAFFHDYFSQFLAKVKALELLIVSLQTTNYVWPPKFFSETGKLDK